MIDPSSSKVAVLGLGIIGSRACTQLLDAGWQVTCWNRTPKNLPHEAASAAAAVLGADVISLYLKDAPAVREVIQQITSALKPGQILLNHSTIDLDTTRWLDQFCAEHGLRFLDCPFTGSKVAAGIGQLVYYMGGDAALAAELDPFLSVTSKSRQHCGSIGSATVIKLATNLITACVVEALAEALAITIHHGVPAECLIKAVSENVSSSALTNMKLPMMAAGEFDTHFSLANMGKDTRYMLTLAETAGIEVPAIQAVSKRMADFCGQGMGELDFSALAKPYIDLA